MSIVQIGLELLKNDKEEKIEKNKSKKHYV
jgi:hypothetical protein